MILVIGDAMIDAYVRGTVNRISPEAPVPVFQRTSESMVLGGAANVARNVVSLGETCGLVTAIGSDNPAHHLSYACISNKIHSDFLFSGKRKTTVKTRFEAQGQQILRVDDECANDLDEEDEHALTEKIDDFLTNSDVIVLSDYAKGVLTKSLTKWVIQEAQERNIPVIVDPKGTDYSKYLGATIIKPNADELAKATGMPTGTKEECLAAASTLPFPNVLVTRAAKGMLFWTGNDIFEEQALAREVADVVGAGDTALAAVALGMSKNWTPDKIIQFANMAAAIVVGKHGTATVTRQEVYDAFGRA